MANYISNKEFTQAIVEYINECNELEAQGKEIKQIPIPIARQFDVLATKLGSRYNFAGYSFRDEMVANALYACCRSVRKFNAAISSNAFAYFTNVCWRARVDIINEVAKNSYIKAKSFQDMDFDMTLADNDLSEFSDHTGTVNDFIPYFDIEEYEKKNELIKQKNKTKKNKVAENALDV